MALQAFLTTQPTLLPPSELSSLRDQVTHVEGPPATRALTTRLYRIVKTQDADLRTQQEIIKKTNEVNIALRAIVDGSSSEMKETEGRLDVLERRNVDNQLENQRLIENNRVLQANLENARQEGKREHAVFETTANELKAEVTTNNNDVVALEKNCIMQTVDLVKIPIIFVADCAICIFNFIFCQGTIEAGKKND